VGIDHLVDRYPSEMSGGQQQRLALARALVVGQRIVLFDEPLSNVDAQVRERLRLELIRMQRDLGFTAIYVTHDQSEAMELADRIAVMDHGRIAQIGAPREMYELPGSVHVARFLGQSNEIPFVVEQINLEDGTIRGSSALGTLTAVLNTEGNLAPPAGSQLAAFGRPGDFELTKDTGTAAIDEGQKVGLHADNICSGTVESVRFLGTHIQYVVQSGGLRLRCWATADAIEAKEGDSVRIRVPVRSLRVVANVGDAEQA
jgi:iron(III) transport system ATP-binding protein